MSHNSQQPSPNRFNIDIDKIPAEMKAKRNWINWKYLPRGPEEKPTKVPIRPNGWPAKSNDPATWSAFDRVINSTAKEAAGIGYVFDGVVGPDGLCDVGIDLDSINRPKDNEPNEIEMWRRRKRAVRYLQEALTLGAYAEKSPSGGGVHIVGRAKPLVSGIARDDVEIYTSGRYFTVTANAAGGNGGADISAFVDRLAAEAQQGRSGSQQSQQQAQTRGPGLGPRLAHIFGSGLGINQNAAAVLDPQGFEALTTEQKNEWVEAILKLPDVAAIADADYPEWRDFVWAIAAAAHLGADQAYDLAREWSKQAKHKTFDQKIFDQIWHGYDPHRSNGITVGTLLDAARQAGIDLGAAFTAARAALQTATGGGGAGGAGSAPPAFGAPWTPPDPAKRPMIIAVKGEDHASTNESLAAMLAAEVPFYEQGTSLVKVDYVRIKLADGSEVPTPAAVITTRDIVARAMTETADWRKRNADGKLPKADPPPGAVGQVCSMGHTWFPPLKGIISTPFMRADGSLLTEPGYDPATGFVLFNPPPLPPIPAHPTRRHAAVALNILRKLLAEFPFVGRLSRACAYAQLITSVARPAMDVAPMFITIKPQQGTGGTYLADVTAAICLGIKAAPPIVWSLNPQEIEKELNAAALMQRPLILVDNAVGSLRSVLLGHLAERPMVDVRPLGESKLVPVHNGSLVLCNGNNLEIGSDMIRRSILIRMDANCERPQDRKFKRNPVADVLQDRGKYIATILTVLRAYHVAGYPGRLPPHPGYGAWSNTVRSALVWLGQPDPVDSLKTLATLDPETTDRLGVFDAWAAELGVNTPTNPMTGYQVKDLIDEATKRNKAPGSAMFGAKGPLVHPDVNEALREVAPAKDDADGISPKQLGKWLRRNTNTVAGGYKLIADASDPARPRYTLGMP
jgi:putative DNA primase/helicase